jgi:RHS repeat-associated protein
LVFQSVTNKAVNGATSSNQVGNVFLPETPESFSYDYDGNLLSDGHWSYTWDAENRLIQMVANTGLPNAARFSITNTYDWRGRRIQKSVGLWNGSVYALQYTRRFLYDGWNVVAELDGSNTLIRSYIWGNDLSGSIQGAGGVGGLLVVKPASGDSLFVAYDGSGNVVGLLDGSTGTAVAQYAYGPFGEVIELTPGTSGNPCPFRFSTKYDDDETDLLYYGYRYYNPGTGRWLGRDPIEEKGGANLYGFLQNEPIKHVDVLGTAPLPYSHFDVEFKEKGHYRSFVTILFSSGKDQGTVCSSCKSGQIKLAQIVSVTYEDLTDNLFFSQPWQLDTDSKNKPWYPYQSGAFGWAVMQDSPGLVWWAPAPGYHLYGETQNFETCAFCVGSHKLSILGCTSWGQSVGGLRHATFWGDGIKLPVAPSADFTRLFSQALWQ